MNKPLWITFITGFFVLFSFQNCQQPPHMDEINSVSTNAQILTNTNAVALSEQKISEVVLNSKVQQNFQKNGTSFTMVIERRYEFAFDNMGLKNNFIVSDENSNEIKSFCLTTSLKNELQSILKSASVCKKSDGPKDQLCSAVMIPSYGAIQTEAETYELGAATDSCGSNSIDLCGSEADLLKGFTKHLDSKLQTLLCI